MSKVSTFGWIASGLARVNLNRCQSTLTFCRPSIELPGLRRPMTTDGPFVFDGKDMKMIERSQIVQALDSAPTVWENGGVKIVRIADNAVVKYGHDIKISEAKNMVYVDKHTSIRLPYVFDAWVESGGKDTNDENDICFLVMSYIDGRCLDEVWSELSDSSRDDVQQQLYQFIRELRQIESECPGPIGGGVSQGAFFTDYDAGPFISKDEMEAWFDERLAVCRDFGLADKGQKGFRGLFSRLVMCHMDLHPRNVILDSQGNAWLIDWEYAGMYPPYFETATVLRYGREPYFRGLLDLLGDKAYEEEISRLFSISFALTTGALCKPASVSDRLDSPV